MGPPSGWGGGGKAWQREARARSQGRGASAAGGDREGAARGEGRGLGAAWPALGWDRCSSLGAEPQRPDLMLLGRQLAMQGATTSGHWTGAAPRSLTLGGDFAGP